jgi:hypothetical protein
MALVHTRDWSNVILALREPPQFERRILPLMAAIALVILTLTSLSWSRKSDVDYGSVIGAHHLVQSTLSMQQPAGLNRPTGSIGYVVVLATLGLVTPGTAQGLACWAAPRDDCKATQLPVLIAAQIVIAALSLLLIYRVALRASGRPGIALITVVLAFYSMRLGEFAGLLRGHIWYGFALLAYIDCLTAAWTWTSWPRALCAGAALAFACLFQPLAIVLLPVTLVMLMTGDGQAQGSRSTGSIRNSVALCVGFAVFGSAVLSWPALAISYELSELWLPIGMDFAQRIALMGIDASNRLASLVTPIPWIGDLLSGLVPKADLRKLSIAAAPGSFVHEGATRLYPALLERANQSGSGAIGLVLRETFVDHLVDYVVSLPSVVMRGVFAGGGIIALVGLFHVRPMMRFARAQGRSGIHRLVLVPIVALFVVNAVFTSNAFWFNPLVPVLYAYAIAYVAGGW